MGRVQLIRVIIKRTLTPIFYFKFNEKFLHYDKNTDFIRQDYDLKKEIWTW